MTAIEPGSRWVAKDGSREVVVEDWTHNRGDVRNVATGRVFSISRATLRAKYRRVEGAEQVTRANACEICKATGECVNTIHPGTPLPGRTEHFGRRERGAGDVAAILTGQAVDQ